MIRWQIAMMPKRAIALAEALEHHRIDRRYVEREPLGACRRSLITITKVCLIKRKIIYRGTYPRYFCVLGPA